MLMEGHRSCQVQSFVGRPVPPCPAPYYDSANFTRQAMRGPHPLLAAAFFRLAGLQSTLFRKTGRFPPGLLIRGESGRLPRAGTLQNASGWKRTSVQSPWWRSLERPMET